MDLRDDGDVTEILSAEVIRETLRRVTGKKGATHRRVANRAFTYAIIEHLPIEEAIAFVLLVGVAYGHSLTAKLLDGD